MGQELRKFTRKKFLPGQAAELPKTDSLNYFRGPATYLCLTGTTFNGPSRTWYHWTHGLCIKQALVFTDVDLV